MKHYIQSILLLSLPAFTLTSCSSFTHTQRGSLSEAIEKSADDYPGNRQVADSYKDENNGHQTFFAHNVNSDSGSDSHFYADTNTPDDTLHFPYIGFKAHSSLKYSSKFGNESGGSLAFTTKIKNKRQHAGYFGAGVIPTKETSDINGSIPRFIELHLGYQYRFHSTPDHTLLGLYLPIEFNIKSLFWKYNNPLTSNVVDENGSFNGTEKIEYDGLLGFALGTGGGVTFIKTDKIQTSAEITAGGTLYWPDTYQSFKNDIFRGDLYFKLALEVLLRYKKT